MVEMDDRSYVKILLRSSVILMVEKDEKYCFLWSILAYSHPCKNIHPNRVSNYKPCFNELNIEGFDFANGFKCTDVHRCEKLKIFTINIFELSFCQDQKKWRHKLIPIEITKKDSDRFIDLSIYINQYVPFEKLNVYSGDHRKSFVCRRCLNSFTSENMLKIHKPNCENNDITTIGKSSISHFHRKKQFHGKIHYISEYMQISKLIMKKTILVQVIKQLIFVNKTQYPKVLL